MKGRFFCENLYLCKQNFSDMETANKSTTMDWIIFFASTIIMTGMLMYMSEWFWVALPFVLTYLVKALRAI